MKYPNCKLSGRELDILLLIAKEYTSAEIDIQLSLSTHTVISHRKRLMRKLQAPNTAGMIYKAFQKGILKERKMVINHP